jgi:two-component system invasion response regulator UvrY
MPLNNINVLLVDDHELVRTGIEHLLGQDPDIEVIAVASSGEEGIDLASKIDHDVILMDLNMPGIGGIEAIKRILRRDPASKIIALSVYDDGPVPNQAITHGAMGYINKGCPADEMIKAVTTVYQGRKYISSDVARNIALSPIDINSHIFKKLSKRELQIAMKIVDGHKVADIADELSISQKTVNTHRYRMHEKLGVESDIELVLLAAENGMLGNI